MFFGASLPLTESVHGLTVRLGTRFRTTRNANTSKDFPPSPALAHFEANLERAGFVHDFPLLIDPDVRSASGSRGRPFLRTVRTRYWYDATHDKIEGLAYFPMDCEGPAGNVHGGCLAAVLDNILGYQSLRSVGLGCVTLQLNVSYRKLVPLGSCVRFDSSKERVDGRKVHCRARLLSLDGRAVHTEAQALFYKTSEKMLSYEDALTMFGRESSMTKTEFLAHLRARRARREQQQEELRQRGGGAPTTAAKL